MKMLSVTLGAFLLSFSALAAPTASELSSIRTQVVAFQQKVTPRHRLLPLRISDYREFMVSPTTKLSLVTVEYATNSGKGEQTYLLRTPQQSPNGLTDLMLASSIYDIPNEAKDVKVAIPEMLLMGQLAADETVKAVSRELQIPLNQMVWVKAMPLGERFKSPAAVIFSVQIGTKSSPVPLDRKVYVVRGTHQVQIGFED